MKWPEEWKATKVKRKKITEKDIQENIRRIMEAIKATPHGTDEYERLAGELEHEYVILKKYKDSRFIIEPTLWVRTISITGLVVFFLCLEREVPSVMKFADRILRFVPFRG